MNIEARIFTWIKRHRILSVLLALLVVFFVACTAFLYRISYELSGKQLCDEWRPDMTRDEKLRLVLELANESRELAFEFFDPENGASYLTSAKQIPYANIDEILNENPGCCRLVVQGSYDSNPQAAEQASENVSGDDEGTVILRYNGHYRDNAGRIQTAKVYTHMNLNFCKD